VTGGAAIAVRADVTVAGEVDELVRRTVDEWGRIDILVNNVGGGGYRPLLDTDEATWDAIIALNLKTVYLCTRAAGRVMVEQKSGNIINISTGQASWPTPGNGAHYGAAKAGMEVFSRTMAQEWGPHNIRVNVVVPGVVETPLLRQVYADRPEELQATVARIPLGRIAQPDDLLGAVLFLASDASSYISGTSLLVRGGRFG
jgi:NAD(P)-dependent dehydrogenase (short-subunit alcohol dehydrogenase family)